MAATRAILRAGALALAALVGLSACTGGAAPSAAVIQAFAPADRKAAPTLTGELLDGSGTFDPRGLSGQVVVVNFWGAWCGPCIGEAPELESVYSAHRAEGLAFVGIDVRDELDNARAFAAQNLTYPSIFDPASELALSFAVQPNGVPATIILDRQGRIAAVARGPVVRSELEPVVVALLEESSGRGPG